MTNLRTATIRGGFARIGAQGTNFVVRFGSLAILARLLGPKEFGLVGMVTAFTGVLGLLRDFGLSSAAVQRATVTKEQMSTLFWVNVFAGGALGAALAACGPAIASFYHERRLVGVTAVLALGFVFNAAGVQHLVALQRQMRFTTLSMIGVISTLTGAVVGIAGAKAGLGYWALAVMTVVVPLTATTGFWVAAKWIPGLPRRRCGLRSMIQFGGTVTLNSIVVYVATNIEKVLLGRFWGLDAIGLYGRAYQLITIPTDNLHSAAGEVTFSVLSRLQNDPLRLRNYFLKGYSLLVAITLPITVTCALFADDIILVALGPKWSEAAPLFRLLAPTILVFAISNPLSWLLSALGRVQRLLKMGLVIAPVMIASYVAGLRYGPKGVALAYSTVMVLWLVPLVIWTLHGTMISPWDIVRRAGPALGSSLASGVLAYAVRMVWGHTLAPWPRLAVDAGVLFAVFFGLLLCIGEQRSFYLRLLRELTRRDVEQPAAAAAA